MNTPKQEVVWVMGPSAAGKETFVRRLCSDAALAATLGLAGRVVPAEASLRYIKQSPDDPIGEKREEILEEVPRLLQTADAVVNKWQFIDTQAQRPEKLQKLLPDVGHTAIVLVANPEELLTTRLPNKPWWNQYGYAEWVADELPMVAEAVQALPQDFTVVHLQSGGPNNYQILEAGRH